MAGTTGRMAEADLCAFDPIPFPEIAPGVTFNANFCRNPMCPNFGPAPDRGSYAGRYTVEPARGFLADRRYRCGACGMISRLLSNRSLRAAYVWFKRQSIPFAACRNPGCANEGINVFEHSGCYEAHARDRARCRECTTTFSLGGPTRLHLGRDEPGELEARLATIFWNVRKGRGIRETLEELEEEEDPRGNPSHYEAAVRNVGLRVRDYQSYNAAALMTPDCTEQLRRLFARENGGRDPGPEDSPFNGVATLRTDTLYGSLRRPRKAYRPRFHWLPVLVTALRFHEPATYFVLGAHPCAVFGKENLPPADPAAAMADGSLPVAERRFDHLFHFGTDHGDAALRGNKYSYLGGGALFMREEYAELAHFMVLKEQTARFDRVTLSLDGKYTAYRSAAAVFAGDMRTPAAAKGGDGDGNDDIRRVEISVVQIAGSEGRARFSETSAPTWTSETKRLGEAWRDRIGEELAQDGPDLLGGEDPRRLTRAKAELFRKVMHGAWSERGGWGWRERSGWENTRLAVLWLSQGPDRDWPPSEEIDAFLEDASPQSVDSAIGALRRRSQAVARPGMRAEPGSSFAKSMVNAEYACFKLWAAWFAMNFTRPKRSLARGKNPAHWLGLLPWEERSGRPIARKPDFRLGWREAREMTRRLGNG